MHISYITTYNALDIHNWSGLGLSISKSLENQGLDLDYIGNLKKKISLKSKFKSLTYPYLMNKRYDINRDLNVVKRYSVEVSNRLKSNTDIIFSPGTIPIAFLESNKPKVIYTDATFASMIGFYDSFSNFCDETISNGNYIEKMALESASAVIYSSDWAAKSAIDFYGINPNKIHVVPFGSNIESNISINSFNHLLKRRSNDTLDLLFVGVDWIRKGGDLAVKITKHLNNCGIPTTLHIVGIKNMPNNILNSNIINYGYISKRTDEGRNLMRHLYQKCHFLLVPSIAECSGVVFCEASSFGMPSLTHDVGGASTVITNNVNGMLFNLNSEVDIWCNYILKVFLDKSIYRDICHQTFNEYEIKLNWKVSGVKLKNILKEI